eukprot:3773973-Rhodomonas_salina.2
MLHEPQAGPSDLLPGLGGLDGDQDSHALPPPQRPVLCAPQLTEHHDGTMPEKHTAGCQMIGWIVRYYSTPPPTGIRVALPSVILPPLLLSCPPSLHLPPYPLPSLPVPFYFSIPQSQSWIRHGPHHFDAACVTQALPLLPPPVTPAAH